MYLLMCFLSVMFCLFLGCFEALLYCRNDRFDLLFKELLKLQVPYLIVSPMIQLLLQFLNCSADKLFLVGYFYIKFIRICVMH